MRSVSVSAAWVLVCAAGVCGQVGPIEILAREGSAYAPLGAGATVGNLWRDQYIAEDGSIAFTGYLERQSQARPAVFAMTPQGPSAVLVAQLPVPGMPQFYFEGAEQFRAQEGGAVLSASALESGPTPLNALLLSAPSGTVALGMQGDAAPGAPAGSVFKSFIFPSRRGERVAFVGDFGPASGPSSGSGVWVRQGEMTIPLAVSGGAAPGFPAGATFTQFSEGPRIGASGYVYFHAWVSGSRGGIYRWDGQTTALLVPINVPLAGWGGAEIGFASGVTPLEDGSVYFFGSIRDGLSTPPAFDITGIFRVSDSGVAPIAYVGASVPGVSGARFSVLGGGLSQFYASANGRVAFRGTFVGAGVTPENNTGLWEGIPGSLRLIAREGDQVPGLPAGVVYDGVFDCTVNARGQVVFAAFLRGAGVVPGNSYVLMYADAQGYTWPIVRAGSPLNGPGGQVVNYFEWSSDHGSGAGAQPTQLTEGGEFVFYLQFLPDPHDAIARVRLNPCYANCDGSTAEPVLNVSDFQCFLNRFQAGDPYANCDRSTGSPALTVLDFSCFLGRFNAGCP